MRMGRATAEFLSGYFSTHDRRKKTETAYRSDLAQFQAFAGADGSISKLGAAVIENWAAHLRRGGYSPASIRRKMAALKVFCSYWVRKGELNESPFWRVRLSYGRVDQLPRSLTKREMRKLLARARGNYSAAGEACGREVPSHGDGAAPVTRIQGAQEPGAGRAPFRDGDAGRRGVGPRRQGLRVQGERLQGTG